MRNFNFKKLAVAAALASVASLASFPAHAETNWQKKHPRRKQVNSRLENQQDRVDQGLTNGKLNAQQASKIQSQDQSIRLQQQRDAAANGGHITKVEQKRLNREGNHVSNEIKRDESQNSAAPAPVAQPPSQ